MSFFTETQVHALTYALKQAPPPLPFLFDVEIKVDVCTEPPEASLLTYLFMSNSFPKPLNPNHISECGTLKSELIFLQPRASIFKLYQTILATKCLRSRQPDWLCCSLAWMVKKNQRSGSQRECQTGRSRRRCVRGGGGMKKSGRAWAKMSFSQLRR